jgi:hypothetical protein
VEPDLRRAEAVERAAKFELLASDEYVLELDPDSPCQDFDL